MTICLYNDRTMYADRAGLAVSRPARFIEIKKLYVSPCSRFVIAASGISFPNNEYYAKIMQDLGEILKQAAPFEASIVLPKEILSYWGRREILVMTREKIYVLGSNSVNHDQLLVLDVNVPAVIGSGATHASIALAAGKSAMDAMRIGSIVDDVSYLTDIDSIAAKDLHPF